MDVVFIVIIKAYFYIIVNKFDYIKNTKNEIDTFLGF
jgi:hypothetical protein